MAPRPRNAERTRAAILDAAREAFAADGYERTTMRGVARAVGVDPALVLRYFGTKAELFAAAAALDLTLPDLSAVAPEDLAGALLPVFFQVWEEDGTFLALLRAAMTSETAAAALRDVFARQVAPALGAVAPDHPRERAALVGALIMGLATTREALEAPAVRDLSRERLEAWLAPVVAQLLTGPAPA